MEEQSPISSYVVTLIHGTWGRNSPWVAASSKFREQLQEHLGGVVKFYEIPWSGANSHSARQVAVKNLAEHIDRVANEHNHDFHFLISHSHGGNISLYALRAPIHQAAVSGVVCMNTPFVCILCRNTVKLIFLIGAMTLAWVTTLSIIYLFSYFGHRGEVAGWFDTFNAFPWWQKALLGLIGYAILTGFIHLVAAVMLRFTEIIRRVAKWTLAQREALIEDIALPRTAVPILSIRSVGDEVVGAVAFSTTVANTPFALLHPWSLVAMFGVLFTAHWAGWLSTLVSTFTSREARELYARMPAAEIPQRILDYGLSSGIYLIATVTLVLLVALAAAPLLRMAPLGLGWRHLLNSLFVNLSFTYVPVTSTHTEFLDIDSETRGFFTLSHSRKHRPMSIFGLKDVFARVRGIFTLSHSRIYEQADTIKNIADWIKRRSTESKLRTKEQELSHQSR